MKKFAALVLAFSLSASASAATWEYALYTEIDGIGPSWTTPEGSVTGKTITDILTGMKCDLKGIAGLLNCAGAQGWELTAYTSESGQLAVTRYIFKRMKP